MSIKNIFIVGEPIYKIAMENKILPYVAEEIAVRGWSDNTIISKKASKMLYERHKANLRMLDEHGQS